MIPASLRKVLDKQRAGPAGDVTTIWRDGSVLRGRKARPAIDPLANGTCPNCGGKIIGDGYTTPLRCEEATADDLTEPDGRVILCELFEDNPFPQ